MANKGSSSTPEIKINFSYESKTSANKKLKDRITEIEQVAKTVTVGIDFKANSESMKSLKSNLTTVKNNLNKLTLETFNKDLKESLTTAQKLAIEIGKSARLVSKNNLINRTGNTNYDLKAVKEAEKQSLASIKAQEKAYKEMVKEQNKALNDAIKEQKKSYSEAQKALEELAKKQAKLDGTKVNKQQKLDLNIEGFQKTLNLISQSGNISEQVITDMQREVNNFSLDSADIEIEDFKKRLQTLAKNDSSITQLNKKIETIQTTLRDLKTKAITVENEPAIRSLEELENQLNEVKNVSRLMSNGMEVNMNGINPSIDKLNAGIKEIGNSLKTVSSNSNSFMSTFKQIALTFGLLDVGRTAINLVVSSFKEGVGTVVSMDTALADLNKVVDLTSAGLDRARESAVQLGQQLGSSAVDVVKAQAEFGRVYKDLDTINKMTETAIMGANVMDGLSVDQVAKGLNTVISSLKLSSNEVVDILDSMNEVQNNFNISSDNMLQALGRVGSTAKTAGASLQELEGYITAIAEATGAEGGEVGNALRSIMTRIYKIGQDTFDEGDPEEALKAIGVAVRNASGEFRNINDILTDLDKVWGNLSQTEKIATGQVVAGEDLCLCA